MTDINTKLDFLYDILIDHSAVFEQEIIDLISQPLTIGNVNKFASLLRDLKNPVFIEPLLLQISLGEKGDVWLSEFLYAASNLLYEDVADQEFETPKNLILKLGSWIIDNTGELAWMAASVLKFSPGKRAEIIQLKKLEERGDFFLTYVECIRGLLRHNEARYLPLVEEIAADETRDIKLRDYCRELIDKST